MGRNQFGFGHMTIVCLAVGLSQWIVCANKDIPAGNLPKGACSLENQIIDLSNLECTPDVKSAFGNKLYFEEQTYCSDELETQCVTCIEGKMQIKPCHEPAKERPKRWFWGRRRRRGPPPNTAPRITCPSIASSFTAPHGSDTAVVTWGRPSTSDSQNNIRSTLQISGKPSGSRFGEGRHAVSYRVTDAGGLSSTCSASFNVVVIKCPVPSSPANGRVQCPSGNRVVYGKKCTYACNHGYQRSGPSTVECKNNGRFNSVTKCNKISCGSPPVPKNAKSVSCTAGHVYGSVCSPLCSQGYQPRNSARVICQANKKWSAVSFTCEDTTKPVFTKCPTKKINTIDRKYKWTVTATDSSGRVTLKQVQGHPPGSLMDFGAHVIKYVATDASGNSASCAFAIELKKSDCPKPSSTDTDIQFKCNGLIAESYCQLTCKSGARVEGSKYIACAQDKSQNNTSYWEPVEGQMATCNRRKCPSLNTPKNGALVCDKQLGGTVCQIQCNENYDVSFGDEKSHTFFCGTGSDSWKPRNTAPDCLELSFPDDYYLPTDFYYFTGDCSDPQALNAIKQQFIDNLNSIGISPCMTDVCSVDDIQVDCGDKMESTDFGFSRKRGINPKKRVLRVRVKFHVKNTNRTLSPEAADALLKSMADKSKKVMSKTPAMRTMLSKTLAPKIHKIGTSSLWSKGNIRPMAMVASIRPAAITQAVVKQVEAKTVTGKMAVKCKAGHAQTETGACVPCSAGSYADVKTNTCKPCLVNTYQNKPVMSSCLACPAHHVTSSNGTVTKEECKKQCRPETFSPTGLVPCFPCPDGRYQPQYGSTTCQVCPEARVVSRVQQKCLQHTTMSKNTTDLKISNFLLTCGSESCLSF